MEQVEFSTGGREVSTEAAVSHIGFTRADNAVIRDASLSRDARLTYVMLRSFMYGDKNDCFPGHKLLAKYLDCSQKTVRGYLDELIDTGLLQKRRRGQGKTNYYVLKPLTAGSDWKRTTDQERKPVTELERKRTTGEEEEVEIEKLKNLSEGESLRAPAGKKVSPREQDSGKRSPSKTTSPNSETSSQGGLVKGLMSRLVSGIQLSGGEISPEQKEKIAGGLGRLHRKGTEQREFVQAVDRIAARWPDYQLSVEQAITDIRDNGRRGSGGKQTGNPSPSGVAEAFKTWTDKNDRQRLAPFAQLAEQFDFTSEEEPPWPILARLGQTEDERTRNLKACRNIARRAVSGDLGPSPAPGEPAEGSTPDQLTEDDQRTIQRILEDPASTRAKELKARCVDDPDGLRYTQDLVDPVCIEAFGGRVRGPRELLIGQFVQVWIEREREAVVV